MKVVVVNLVLTQRDSDLTRLRHKSWECEYLQMLEGVTLSPTRDTQIFVTKVSTLVQ